MTEPTLSDVLAQLTQLDQRFTQRFDQVDRRVDLLDHKIDTVALELRAGIAEVRAQNAETRTTLHTIIDRLADFRKEYAQHTHGNESAA